MNYEEQIKRILEESTSEIQTQIKEALNQKIADSISWNLSSTIGDLVKKFVAEELTDEVQQAIIELKPIILESMRPAFVTAGVELAKTLEKKVIDNMATSYKCETVLKSIMG